MGWLVDIFRNKIVKLWLRNNHIWNVEIELAKKVLQDFSPVSLSQNMTQPQTNCNRIYLYGIMYIDYLQITRKKSRGSTVGRLVFFMILYAPPPMFNISINLELPQTYFIAPL